MADLRIDGVTGKVVAQYLIQVTLMNRPKQTNVLGAFFVWRKQGLFGVADESMGFCPAHGCLGMLPRMPRLSESDAAAVKANMETPEELPDDVMRRVMGQVDEHKTCPVCLAKLHRLEMADSYNFNMAPSRIAQRVEEMFNLLDRSADVMLVRPDSLDGLQRANQYLATPGRSLAKYSDKLDAARKRDSVFYSLDSILRDTAGGSSIAKRVEALVRG